MRVSVRLSVRENIGNRVSELHHISCPWQRLAASSSGSVAICISGFVDDVVLSYYGTNAGVLLYRNSVEHGLCGTGCVLSRSTAGAPMLDEPLVVRDVGAKFAMHYCLVFELK